MARPPIFPTTTEEHYPASSGAAAAGEPALLCAFPKSIGLKLPASGAVVGRAWLAEAGLIDGKVSTEHMRLSRADGRVYAQDAGSKNGTWVNGARLAGGERAPLADGAVLRIGRTLLVYRSSFGSDLSPARPIGRLVGPFGLGEVRARLAELSKHPEQNVLLEGATGTGKELLAAAVIHALDRGKKPLGSINVAAVASGVFEAQLFGWLKGAFSGSADGGKGVFRENDGGSVFLDEIGELPLDLQPKLLRALENRQIQPVGSSGPVKVDVAVIAATNRPLDEDVERGQFRRDLYARFTARLRLPTLAERREDIYAILESLAERRGFALDAGSAEIEAVERLVLADWSANVRDLDRVAAAIAVAGKISFAVVEKELPSRSQKGRLTREEAERMVSECGGNQREVERRFGVSRGSLRRALQKGEANE